MLEVAGGGSGGNRASIGVGLRISPVDVRVFGRERAAHLGVRQAGDGAEGFGAQGFGGLPLVGDW